MFDINAPLNPPLGVEKKSMNRVRDSLNCEVNCLQTRWKFWFVRDKVDFRRSVSDIPGDNDVSGGISGGDSRGTRHPGGDKRPV